MSIERKIKCAVCSMEEREKVHNGGFNGWVAIHGVKLNDEENPTLCPVCKTLMMNFIDKMAEEYKQ